MREILFRGRRCHDGQWLYGNLVYDEEHRPHIVPEKFFYEDGHHLNYYDGTDSPVFLDEETVGQFTGLKDKNGKRIFDGDIAKIYDASGYLEIAVVKYGEHGSRCLFDTNAEIGFYLLFAKPGKRNSLRVNLPYWAKDERFEVIGNVYDNPELIGGAK